MFAIQIPTVYIGWLNWCYCITIDLVAFNLDDRPFFNPQKDVKKVKIATIGLRGNNKLCQIYFYWLKHRITGLSWVRNSDAQYLISILNVENFRCDFEIIPMTLKLSNFLTFRRCCTLAMVAPMAVTWLYISCQIWFFWILVVLASRPTPPLSICLFAKILVAISILWCGKRKLRTEGARGTLGFLGDGFLFVGDISNHSFLEHQGRLSKLKNNRFVCLSGLRTGTRSQKLGKD